ncbi:MAG: hypothetical protein WDO73_27310 [Ignavibacteriota bacterium]
MFRALAARMGLDDPCLRDSDDDMIRTLLDSPHPFVKGITLEELDRERSVRLRLPQPFQPFAEGGFGTADGRCHFRAETLGLYATRGIAAGRPATRREISAGHDFA